jgi:hypothetical protein
MFVWQHACLCLIIDIWLFANNCNCLQIELYGKVHCHEAEFKIHMSHQIFALLVQCAA